MKTVDKVQAINEHLENKGYHDDMIYPFDEHTVNEFFNNPFKALKTGHFGNINFTHSYFRFDGYGNLETLPDWQIDKEFEELEDEE